MKFTVILPSHESCDFAYGLVFVPCPIWIQGTREILNLNPESPHYQKGGVRRLIEKENIALSKNTQGILKCIVVTHANEGHGSEDDLNTLKDDLRDEGFAVEVVSLSSEKIFS